MVEYKHSLSKVLANGFRKVAHAVPKTGQFDIAKCGLTYSERENLRKLQYWNLILKLGDPDNKGGQWIISKLGWRWLRGEIGQPKSVWTYRGTVQKYSEGDRVRIQDVLGGWKYKPEYAEESVPHDG